MTMTMKTMAKILLAEDDDDMRNFLVKALQKAGHEVTSFGEGLSAFEEIKQTSFDLLLTDIVMPEMDGITAAEQIISLAPVLMLTAKGQKKDRRAAEDAGVSKFMTKPFDNEELIKHVKLMINS